MTFWRFQFLKLVVTLALFVISVLPALYAIGGLASLVPKASYDLAFWLLAIIWFIGMGMGARIISEKLSKRWSR